MDFSWFFTFFFIDLLMFVQWVLHHFFDTFSEGFCKFSELNFEPRETWKYQKTICFYTLICMRHFSQTINFQRDFQSISVSFVHSFFMKFLVFLVLFFALIFYLVFNGRWCQKGVKIHPKIHPKSIKNPSVFRDLSRTDFLVHLALSRVPKSDRRLLILNY